jgi:hypothetical protein
MNKILLTIAGLAAAVTGLAQGTVNLNNNFTPSGATSKAFILGASGASLLGGTVEILDSTGALIKSGAVGAQANTAGLFFLGITAIPGAVNTGTTTITIRAWDNASGSSWDSATLKNSQLVTLDPNKAVPPGFGGGTTPAPGLAAVGNFTGFTLVPEPSTYALAALGILGLFFVARRK